MGHCHDGLGEDHLEMWTQLGYKYSAKLPEPDRVGLSRCIAKLISLLDFGSQTNFEKSQIVFMYSIGAPSPGSHK